MLAVAMGAERVCLPNLVYAWLPELPFLLVFANHLCSLQVISSQVYISSERCVTNHSFLTGI